MKRAHGLPVPCSHAAPTPAGGGASVIYADTVGDLGYAHELGNYAEYSGGPSTAETHAYARTLLDAATANPGAGGRAGAGGVEGI